ncbi:MAG: hypothetical protein AAF599_04980, partial [Bacteroidota bacterium]
FAHWNNQFSQWLLMLFLPQKFRRKSSQFFPLFHPTRIVALRFFVEDEKRFFFAFHFKRVCRGRKLNNFLPLRNSPISQYYLIFITTPSQSFS